MTIPVSPDVKKDLSFPALPEGSDEIDVLKMDIDDKKLDIFIKYLNIKYKI